MLGQFVLGGSAEAVAGYIELSAKQKKDLVRREKKQLVHVSKSLTDVRL